MNKKLISICALIAMAALVIAGASMAYFSDTIETDRNVLTSGNVDISISENVTSGTGIQFTPGTSVLRELKITCVGESGAYVRIKTESENDLFTFAFEPSEPSVNTYWVDSGNGVYAYTKALSKDESISITVSMSLNTGVNYDKANDKYVLDGSEFTKDELLGAYKITAEAIQTTGFDAYYAAFAALDKSNTSN